MTEPPTEVPFVDLGLQHASAREGLLAAFERVLDTSAFVLGEEVERFEAEFAAYCETRHCVGVSSGTAALAIALRAAGVGAAEEVIVPAHTYVATAFAVRLAGAKVVFADVEPATGLLTAEAIAAVLTPRTAAVIPVHLYGQPCDAEAIAELAAAHGLFVLEDAAQAHGARYRGRRVGSLGGAGAFSFYPSKNLGALGDGGAIVTNDRGLADRARRLRNLGQVRKGEHVAVSGNDRLDGLQAALLREKLPYLDRWNELRNAHAARYRSLIGGAVSTLPERPGADLVHHLFPVRVDEREAVIAKLRRAGIAVGIHYSPTAAWQPTFEPPPDCSAADAWQREELSLPMFPELSALQVERVAAALLDVVAG